MWRRRRRRRRRRGCRRSRNAGDARRYRHARGQTDRTDDRVCRNCEIAAIDRYSASGRRVHHADFRKARAARGRRDAADGNRFARAPGAGREPRVGARAARNRCHLCAAGSGTRGKAAEGGRRQPDGGRPRGERPESCRSAAADGTGADPDGAHRSRLLPRDRADGRGRRRHSRPRRRSRNQGDQADVDRCERRPRGVPQRPGAAGAQAASRPAGAHRRRHGRDDRRRKDLLYLAIGRRTDADGPREDAGIGSGHAAHRSIRALVCDLDDPARTDGAGDGRHAHQRPVVRVRRRAGRRRQRPGCETTVAGARTRRRQQLYGGGRIEGRRKTDCGRHTKDPRRRAGAGGAEIRRS